MPITSKDLLDQLADLQLALEGYSYEKLNVVEARALKSYFETFRSHLEEKIWNPRAEIPQNMTGSANPVGDTLGMITSVSHDLRNPLNGIMGFTDLLGSTELNSDQQKYLQAIRLASKNSLEIVDELLHFSRLKSGIEAQYALPFQLVQILGETRTYIRALLEGKPVNFELYIEGSLPDMVTGDPSKLRRILMNLLGNAVKYTEKGSIELIIRSEPARDRCILKFNVKDTGIGIPRAELPHIFKPYYQAGLDRKDAGEGHGLGLSLVRKLIGEQGGSIRVKSREGRGSNFQFELPYNIYKEDVSEAVVVKPAAPMETELRGAHILIFEDNPLNRELLEARLDKWGCRVFSAPNVPAGLRLLQQEAIDLILMDLRMPLMDGFEATRRIRQHREAPVRKIPIIALTADFSSAEQEKFRKSGIDDLLLKPYDPASLYASIANQIRRTNNRRDKSDLRHDSFPELKVEGRLFSLDYLEKECMGDFRMLADLVGLFRNNLLEFAGRMKFYLKEGNLQAIQASAHKVISGLKLIEATELLRIVEAIRFAATQTRDLNSAALAYEEFLVLYPRVEEALEREMDKRK
ncbi:MAG: response regulator [Bacteroidetes bacterium]|nr:MAG: response regulator [Bacteroidota bacterium]